MGPSAREAEEAAQRELRSQVGEVFNPKFPRYQESNLLISILF